MNILISRCLILSGYSGIEEIKIREEFSISNPDYQMALASGRRPYNIPERFTYFLSSGGRIYMGVGCLPILKRMFSNINVKDTTVFEEDDSVKITNKLLVPREAQAEAVDAVSGRDRGLFKISTGGGKTILGILLMNKFKCKTLVLVDSLSILKQWVEAIKIHMGIKALQITGKKVKVGQVTIAMVQTLSNRKDWCKENESYFSMIILDEYQGIGPNKLTKSAKNYSMEERTQIYNRMGRVLLWFKCKKKFGLSDGGIRSDKQTRCIDFALGEIIYESKFDEMVEAKSIVKPSLVVVPTEFEFDEKFDLAEEYVRGYKELINDTDRIDLIVSDLLKERNEFNLILANNKYYLRLLLGALMTRDPDLGARCAILNSSTPKLLKEKYIQKMRDKEINYLFATSLADKGLDVVTLTRMFNVFPDKFEGKKNQQVGRVVRVGEDKSDTLIYDYVDIMIPLYRSQFVYRFKNTYAERCHVDYNNETVKMCRISRPRKK